MSEQSTSTKPTATPRKGRRTGVATELSVFLKVKPGREQQIREVLTRQSPEDMARGMQALADVGTLHEGRNVLFDNGTRLLIATSFDGDWDPYIEDFSRSFVLEAWDKFLIHCEGWPDEGIASLTLDQAKEFLTAHQVTAARYFRPVPDVTAKERWKEHRAYQAFQQVLDAPEFRQMIENPANQAVVNTPAFQALLDSVAS
jgi:hypothetical protein